MMAREMGKYEVFPQRLRLKPVEELFPGRFAAPIESFQEMFPHNTVTSRTISPPQPDNFEEMLDKALYWGNRKHSDLAMADSRIRYLNDQNRILEARLAKRFKLRVIYVLMAVLGAVLWGLL